MDILHQTLQATGLCSWLAGAARETDENNEDYSSKSANSVYNLMNISMPRKRVPKVAFLLIFF